MKKESSSSTTPMKPQGKSQVNEMNHLQCNVKVSRPVGDYVIWLPDVKIVLTMFSQPGETSKV